jgi:hypothetical protein
MLKFHLVVEKKSGEKNLLFWQFFLEVSVFTLLTVYHNNVQKYTVAQLPQILLGIDIHTVAFVIYLVDRIKWTHNIAFKSGMSNWPS